MKDDIRDRYITIVGEQYVAGVVDEGGLEDVVDYLLITDDGPRKAREHLTNQYDISQIALLPSRDNMVIM